MKFTSPFKETTQPLATETRLAALLPYRAMLDEHTVLLESGELMQILRLDGLNPEGIGGRARALNQKSRLAAMKIIARPDRAVHHHVVKRERSTDPEMSLSATYPETLAADYQADSLGKGFVVEHYLTVFSKRPIDKLNLVADLFKVGVKRADESAEINRQKHSSLKTDVERLSGALALYSPTLIGNFSQDGNVCSGPLSFLYFLINHKHVNFPPRDGLLSEVLAGTRLGFPKGKPMEIRDGVAPPTFCASRSIKDFDTSIQDGCLDDILGLPYEFIISSSFVFFTRDHATKQIQLQANQLSASEDLSFTQQQDLDIALDELASGEVAFGESCLTVFCFSKDSDHLTEGLRQTDAVLDSAGFIGVGDDVGLEANYRAMWPGGWRFRLRRWEGLTSRNFVAMSSFHNAPRSRSNNFWNPGYPITAFKTNFGTTFDFNFHLDDLGNTLIVGQSGGGKTVLLSFLAAAAARSGARLLYLDKDEGAKIFIEACGGQYTNVEEGAGTGFNPFNDLPAQDSNIAFITSLVQSMIELSGVNLNPRDYQVIHDAVSFVYQLDAEHRRLSNVRDFLPQGDDDRLYQALSRWCEGGQLAWLFDSPVNSTPFYRHAINGIDLTSILDQSEILGLFIRYVFHLTENYLLDGTPFMVVADEGWKVLDTPAAEEKVKNLAKIIRKQEGILVFASNNPADLAQTAGGREIVVQSPTKIFVPNPDGKREDYAAYGLTDATLDLILSQPKSARTFVLQQAETSQTLHFDLSALQDHIAVLSTRKKSLRRVAELQNDHGDGWLARFMEESR